ncbi:DUF4197 domain-containing protein [Cryomorpha ignava]|uniref:DUF4197 domain-containing protein n=1 Tax=Cryomorpha ignava TaxID=101383 RepID=A0A7K3WLP3_9FLAO|nr:DUF4197 domain-containing protein [Cryomorpha ignava]NEN22570.1 DUF4197 domain-containing protein [Cryomorpha ignava]
MRKFIPLLAILLMGCSQQEIQRTLEGANEVLYGEGGSLTTSEVASGLKEALVKGTDYAVDFSGVKDGFYKNPRLFIPFPEEAEKVKETALKLGLTSQVNKFEETLNRAAEQAVKEAKPIFVNAITSMTVEDAFGLLKGGDNAATEYLRRKTSAELFNKFEPKVSQAVNQVELTKYWNPLANAYNSATQLTGGETIDPDLTEYVTNRSIDGLFKLIADEEKQIRENPAARVTDLLKKVFGSEAAK